jgi:DNA repair photolyase
MIRAEHIYGNRDRLFLNTELGCSSACTYCYLPTEGFQVGLAKTDQSHRVDSDLLIRALLEDSRTVLGANGTLFSIGCFSEAWDPKNRESTIEIIKALLKFGNPMQLATKRKVGLLDLREITNSPDWYGQLSIYVSSATISHWHEYEPLTVSPAKRFESFASCRELGVQACLYLKPLISGITIKDVMQYGEVMQTYNVPAIVGERFSTEEQTKTSAISKTLFVVHNSESVLMREKLSAYGPVFSQSEDAMAYLRRIQ